MFGKKKEIKEEHQPRAHQSLEEYGIFEIPEDLTDIGQIDHDDINDEDLEAELFALTLEDKTVKATPKKLAPNPKVNLDIIIRESMKDINSDEELSNDENDPDLLDELRFITGDVKNKSNKLEHTINAVKNNVTKLLEERLAIYKIAEKNAKSVNDSNKVRRYNRGIKTLELLLSSCQSGNEIDQNDIPPILPPSALGQYIPKTCTDEISSPEELIDVPREIATELVESTLENDHLLENQELDIEKLSVIHVDEETLNILKHRQKEYKNAALAWKKVDNHKEALKNIKITKQFDRVIDTVLKGNTIDLSNIPPYPIFPGQTAHSVGPCEKDREENNQKALASQPDISVTSMKPLGTLGNLENALKERLEVYRRSKTEAETEENPSKVRRYGRICKQFEDALKQYSRGKTIPLDELPTPPGFPPLKNNPEDSLKLISNLPDESKSKENKLTEPLRHSPEKASTPFTPPQTNAEKKRKVTSRVDKQIEILQQRKLELKTAALKAKNDGDLDLARDYLRQAKGIDPLLAASLAGLPVDINSIPLSPEDKLRLQQENLENTSNDDFTVISSMNFVDEAIATDQEIYENLEEQLKKQIKSCLSTRDHCKTYGDVSNYNKWERLALDYKKDLDMLRVNKRNDLPPPKHHYEIKTYSIVQSCTDLTDADMEISIIRGVNYTKEVDSYVIFELPWHSSAPKSDKTSTIRGTNNPEYDGTFSFTGIIDRKSRQCLRIFKRHSLKCQVWSKGGFLRADSLLGTASIKLQPLETKCVLHDSFPLMDGRKTAGGKLEVKIRLRNPISTKQIEQSKDKWLIIDH